MKYYQLSNNGLINEKLIVNLDAIDSLSASYLDLDPLDCDNYIIHIGVHDSHLHLTYFANTVKYSHSDDEMKMRTYKIALKDYNYIKEYLLSKDEPEPASKRNIDWKAVNEDLSRIMA